MTRITEFFKNTSGAVTLDWVALTAATVVLGIGIAYAVYGPQSGLGVTGVVQNLTSELGQAALNIDGYIANTPVPPPLRNGS